MEATLFTFPSSKPPLSSHSQTLSIKSHVRNPPSLPYFHFPSALHRRRTTICSAISRTKNEETVETVKHHLQGCHLLASIKYKGLTVKQVQDLRKLLPESTNLLVAKNSLVYKVIEFEGTQWEVLKPCMKVFDEVDIPVSVPLAITSSTPISTSQFPPDTSASTSLVGLVEVG
ncbi:hypothetical protein RHSIM_Rhsim07G0202500 [Rhododendron simsii]|uniref:Ribosomal protein L10 n=1 Tax=Rhododendron simsii TaxID=118357 RepID=A0A834GT12_RHOSS|nr:hypothetical protein RHSIM_Rhsim07G0202500 [Rhododendron simsii]